MRIAPFLFPRRSAAAAMSYYSRRGSALPQHGYSSRPYPPPPQDAAGAQHVGGDSHHSAVRAANDSLRRGGPPPQYGYGAPQPPAYGYVYGQPQPQQQQQQVPTYGYVPYNYGHPQQMQPASQYGYGAPNPYGQGAPNPYGHQGNPNPYGYGHPQPYGSAQTNAGFPPPNAGFMPGAAQQPLRLAEYRRRWRFAQQRPPRQAERFKVLSYNILADYLAQEHQFLYERIPSFILDWSWRKEKLVFEFGLWSADILCLQEVDRFTDLERELATRGYSGIWKMRTGNAADGCSIFWRTSRFQLRYNEDIEFNKLDLRDNVAQICVLESVVPGNMQTESIHLSTSPSHPQQAKRVIVCNTHVLYNPKRGDIKLGQVRTLLDRAYAISKMFNDAPVILCGDFNSLPKSPLYNFVLEQKLNLSGLAKSTISGQLPSGSQGAYTSFNISRFRSPSHMTNSREGNIITHSNYQKPQIEARKVENSCLVGREPVLTDTSSDSCLNSESNISHGNKMPCSGSTIPDEQELLSCVEGPAKDTCTSSAEAHSNTTKGDEVTDLPSASATVYDEIRQSDSNEIVDRSHLLLSCESSKDNPDEKEKANEFKSGQNNCTTSEAKSFCFSGSQKFADVLHQMNDMRLEEENNTGPTQLTSPIEMTHQSNCAISDSPGNECTRQVINNHSDSFSCSDELGNHAPFEKDAEVNEVSLPDVNSDASFKEFSGDKDQIASKSNDSAYPYVVTTRRYYDYDPYRWAPDEIKAATGNEECSFVEHNLKLRSVYTDVEDFEGTKDTNKEPLVTSYNRKFMGTVDYIWATEDLQTVQVLDTFPKEILKQTIGFPTKKWGSDHIALACEFAFTK